MGLAAPERASLAESGLVCHPVHPHLAFGRGGARKVLDGNKQSYNEVESDVGEHDGFGGLRA